VLGIEDAEHQESTPGASRLLISKLSCSLVGESERIEIKPGTLAHQVYGNEEAVEKYSCNYSLNPDYREQISQGMLKVVGINAEGAVRVVELEGHRYFMASLFLPQMSSTPAKPHPMIKGYLKEASSFVMRDS
jgi:CTP synthase (UTP-ammonia lyase)